MYPRSTVRQSVPNIVRIPLDWTSNSYCTNILDKLLMSSVPSMLNQLLLCSANMHASK